MGLSTAVLALDAAHWEALGARFSTDTSDPDWPQRIASGSIGTPFMIVDEDGVTTLLVGGSDGRDRTERGLGVLLKLALRGFIDMEDILQAGIGDPRIGAELPTRAASGPSAPGVTDEVLAEILAHLPPIEPAEGGPETNGISEADVMSLLHDAIRNRA